MRKYRITKADLQIVKDKNLGKWFRQLVKRNYKNDKFLVLKKRLLNY